MSIATFVLAAGAAGASLVRCATPTAIVVDVYSELDCTSGAQVVLIGAQSLDALPNSAPTSSATRCELQSDGTYYRGKVVIVPSSSDETVAFAIATRTNGADPSVCLTAGGDCIVAKRQISFITHNELSARIDLRSSCLGVVCPNSETCEEGQCASADISCNGGACALPDAVPGELAAGRAHTCALRIDQRVFCWGANDHGQLGDGTTTPHSVPAQVSDLAGASHLSGGGSGDHTCARIYGEDVSCWGANQFGQLGDGTTTDHLTPVNLGLCSCDDPVLLVSAGASHTCIVRDNGGAVQCWGDNTFGQLGDGTQTAHSAAQPVLSGGAPLMGAVNVSTGDRNACALMQSGSVLCWGDNTTGALGQGDTNPNAGLASVVLPTTATSVSVGDLGACATTAGDPYCWGSNGTGLLGSDPDGGTTLSGTPVDMPALAGAVAVSAANGHACAILGNGDVACWGLNDHGQCGDGTTTNRTTPGTVAGISGATAIAAGASHTCAWTHDGIYCWGDDSSGQLGDGRSSDDGGPLESTTPVKVTLP